MSQIQIENRSSFTAASRGLIAGAPHVRYQDAAQNCEDLDFELARRIGAARAVRECMCSCCLTLFRSAVQTWPGLCKLKCRRRITVWQPACHASCSISCLTCKRSAPRWRASGACKLSRRVQPDGTSGNGTRNAACVLLQQVQRQALTAIFCRKVEQVSEETDALRMALDKHTGRQHR